MYLEEKSKTRNKFCFVLALQWCEQWAQVLGSILSF